MTMSPETTHINGASIRKTFENQDKLPKLPIPELAVNVISVSLKVTDLASMW
jgi:hypothetical protein